MTEISVFCFFPTDLDSCCYFQFVEKVLEEGTKSPRTIRLAALHLTGLWLSNPRILKYYIKEVKLLSLYGSGMLYSFFMHSIISYLPKWHIHNILEFVLPYTTVAFDEDFEAELSDNRDAKIELSVLAKVPEYDPGLTEVSNCLLYFQRLSIWVHAFLSSKILFFRFSLIRSCLHVFLCLSCLIN